MQEKPWPEIQQAFLDAYNYRPTRAEPLYHLAQIYRMKYNMPVLAYMFARAALDIPFPKDDILFVPNAIYDWGVADEVSSTAFFAGYPLVGYEVTRKLLQSGKVPKEHLDRIQKNYESYVNVLEDLLKKGVLSPETAPEGIKVKNRYK